MSVIVKGLKMPKCCKNCEFYWEKDVLFEPMHLCEIKQEYIDNADIHRIPHDCPLTELPEKHGRLIDADAMIDLWKGCRIDGYIEPLLNVRPTIIEAEGDKE